MNRAGKRTQSFHTRQEAEQEKQRRLKLIAQGHSSEPFESLSPFEKQELLVQHQRAQNGGYSLWEAIRSHEKFLESNQLPDMQLDDAVQICLKEKESQGDSPRTLQSLGSVLIRFAAANQGRLLTEMDTDDVTAFVDDLDIGLRTRLGYLSDLRTLFSWALQKGLTELNPVVAAMPGRAARKRIMLTKRSRRKEQVLSVE